MKLVFIITGTTVGGAQIMLHRVLTRLSPEFKPEAMASGVPCAVADVGDSAYIVGDTGRVVGLAHAIDLLLEMSAEAPQILGARA